MPNRFQLKSLFNFFCTEEGHQQQPLSYICIDHSCELQPLMCYLCSLEKHINHEKIESKMFLSQLLFLQQKSQNALPLCATFDSIFLQIKNQIQTNAQSFTNPQLIMTTFYKFRSKNIEYVIDFYNLIEKVYQFAEEASDPSKINKINEFIKNNYFKYFNQLEGEDWAKKNVSESLLSKKISALNDTLLYFQKFKVTSKLNDNQVLRLFAFQSDESKKVKVCFSEELKPPNITILSPFQAKMQKSGSERLIILEPCLSKTISIKKWGVKIIKLASWIGVGVCHINQIQKAKYCFQYSNTGHGNYLISSNGYSWSSFKKEFNSKFQPFSYTTGDVIHLEYHPKQRKIKFKKQSDLNQPTYQLEIQPNDDPIHPEINLTGVNDEVQIINF